jgi:two-component system nitrate/nitrite response regulator NarL
MNSSQTGICTVFVCDSQPIVAEGMRALLASVPGFEYAGAALTLEAALSLLRSRVSPPPPPPAAPAPANIVLIEKTFGQHSIAGFLGALRVYDPQARAIIWGVSISDAESLRFLQTGVRGIVRKTAPLTSLIECLAAVAANESWVTDSGLRGAGARLDTFSRSELTPRERQVMELVEQGYKNREIASELGIRPGTVKIHLKHIFEKTGVRGRFGLALNGLRDRGMVSAVTAVN